MSYQYKTSGTCARLIEFELINGKVKNVVFHGGCNGNLKGIGAIVDGMDAKDVIAKLEEGIMKVASGVKIVPETNSTP